MFVKTSRLFYDEFTGLGGLGVPYYPGRPGDKITCIIEGYFKWGLENKRLVFNSANKSITLTNDLDPASFITDGELKVDDTFVTSSIVNPGPFTVSEITDREIIVVEAVANETIRICDISGTRKITAMDFFSNIIPNSATEDYFSLVDIGTLQKYTVSDIDCEDATVKYFDIATNSFGWVTDNIAITGSISTVTIEGQGITDYKQKFKITQTFIATPLFTKEQFQNFIKDFAPDYYQNDDALKHVFKVDGRFEFDDPEVAHTGSVTDVNGINAWFNRAQKEGRPEYILESIAYEDDVTAEEVEQIDINRVTNVEIIIRSRNGKFTTNTKTLLSHFICPLDESYINTQTNLLQNFILDRKLLSGEQTVSGGENVGTLYQVFGAITSELVSTELFKLSFSVEFGSYLKSLLKSKDIDNRRFAFAVTTQDVAVTGTRQTDRVAVIGDFNNASYDTEDASLFEFVDNFHCYHYPNRGTDEKEDVAGFEGDPIYVDIPFRIQSSVYEKTKSTITISAAPATFSFVWTLSGITINVPFDSSDPETAAELFQDGLDQYFYGFEGSVSYLGATNTWTIIVTSKNPGGPYEGIIPIVGPILGASIAIGAFVQFEDTETNVVTIKSAKIQIVATKDGLEDFVLEEKAFNAEFIRKLDQAQDVELETTRDFKTYEGDLYNEANLSRVKAFDSDTKIGFIARYGFVLRYEDWIAVLPKEEGSAVDVFKNVKDVTHRWVNYSDSGWDLKLRFTVEVIGYDGFVTEFFNDVDIRVLKTSANPDHLPFTAVTEYFDEEGDSINSIVIGGITKIRTTYVGDFSAPPTGYTDPYGRIFADYENSAGISGRRWANTEIPSEDDSPFSPTDSDPAATTSYANGNCRINIYGTSRVVVECYYDDTIDNWGSSVEGIIFYPRLGWKTDKTDCVILDESGQPILTEKGDAIEQEVCS